VRLGGSQTVSPIAGADATGLLSPTSSRVEALKRENLELRCQSNYWKAQHARAVDRIQELEKEKVELTARIKYLEAQLYGRKTEKNSRSERNSEPQISTPAGEAPKKARGQQPGRPGHGRKGYPELPVIEEMHDLKDSQKVCPRCGKPYTPFPGTEDSELIEIEVKAYKRKIRRVRYRAECSCEGTAGIISASAGGKLIPRSTLGISVWELLLVEKYLYQRPLNKCLESLRTYGLNIPAGTVVGGFQKLAGLFDPLMQLLVEKNRGETHWHCDETRWAVFQLTEEKRSFRWYLWLFKSQSTVVYLMDPRRSAEVVGGHLGQLEEGILSVDRYSAYKAFAKNRPHVRLAFCWTHVRRDFLNTAQCFPSLKSWSDEWVQLIGELYHRNALRCQAREDRQEFQAQDKLLRKALRGMKKRLRDELGEQKADADRQKVLESMNKHWKGLQVFVDHPEIPIDNSEAERLLRAAAVGRKNYYGSGAIWSAEFAAMMFSLFHTLLLWGINPRQWLHEYLCDCARFGGTPPPDVSRYVPWQMSKTRRVILSRQVSESQR
jgi:transposase